MDLPITRPSTINYADECDFPEMLKDLSSNKHNGFIRVTSGNDEGFILFKKGKEIAASYDRYSRVDAIEKIKDAMEEGSTIIEVFDVRETQVDFFMEMNRPYIIGSEAYQVIEELKNAGKIVEEAEPQPKAVPKPKPISEVINKPDKTEEIKTESSPVTAPQDTVNNTVTATETVNSDPVIKSQSEDHSLKETDTATPVGTEESSETTQATVVEDKNVSFMETKPESDLSIEKTDTEDISSVDDSNIISDISVESDMQQDEIQNDEEVEDLEMPVMETEPVDRMELMKKYGIKDIQEEDVENILESYKGGSVSDEDIEKIELTLMNKIKKSLLGIPKIKGAEVMVFLENSKGLTGKVNIIIESESKGFLSRIRGDTKDIKLEKQIIDISQIEIRKSFRKYPEIVDKFDVNVEIS